MIDTANVDETFSAWASSYSCCDGGDLNAPIWFCGIEEGGDEFDPTKWEKINKPKGIDDNDDARRIFFSKDYKEKRNNPYDQKVLKLHAAIFNDFNSTGQFKIDGEFLDPNQNKLGYLAYANKHHAYAVIPTNADRSIFKLNLYPLAFRNTNHEHWDEKYSITKLESKKSYIEWCAKNRFPVIRKWAETNHPRIIICTGVDYESHFVSAFLGIREEINLNKKIVLYKNTTNTPLLIVTPFLGQYPNCLNRDEDIFVVGQNIRRLLVESDLFDDENNTFR